VLGLRRLFEQEWGAYPAVLVAGTTGVALFPASGQHLPGDRTEGDGNRHLAFRTSRAGYEEAKRELAGRGIELDEWDLDVAVDLLPKPDSHLIEIATYERSPV
jgi:hypothetical protein